MHTSLIHQNVKSIKPAWHVVEIVLYQFQDKSLRRLAASAFILGASNHIKN